MAQIPRGHVRTGGTRFMPVAFILVYGQADILAPLTRLPRAQ